MKAFVRAALVLFATFFSSAVLATAADHGGARWGCWYESHNLTVQCLLTREPLAGMEKRAAEVAHTIDRRLSKLVEKIWGSPEELANDRISIPLWNTPYEMNFAAQLAESVMCGARLDCSVSFDVNPDGRAPLRVAALKAGVGEHDVMAEMNKQGFQLVIAAAIEADEEPVIERTSSRRRRSLNG